MTNDLISRRKLDGMRLVTISIIESTEVKPDERTRGWNECIDYIQRNAPAVDAAPVVHARWVDTIIGTIKCTLCGCCYNMYEGFAKYCPNCGARMDQEADNAQE